MARRSSRPPRTYERGIACIVIGVAVLAAPMFLRPSRWLEMVEGASLVGWFALVLGIALVAADVVRRARAKPP